RFAVNQAEAGDVILIAGKGHEDYQVVGDEVIDFDDRVEARIAIEKKLGLA
ncbi:UDP-N-acetylmuramoyl-L-alanyl-D-glutamate--2,6-diaminopimelate ligase, partial [Listeria monocytogenes]|nr:UDP-N-acetylmuramoyl-L-alanyl-D-glutamate--2,6-diaminopimelate ligase [Listeria monocytogenes]